MFCRSMQEEIILCAKACEKIEKIIKKEIVVFIFKVFSKFLCDRKNS